MGVNKWGRIRNLMHSALMHGMDTELSIRKGRVKTVLLMVQGPETSGPLRSALYPDLPWSAPDTVYDELEDLLGYQNIHANIEDVMDGLKEIEERGYCVTVPGGARDEP